MKQKGEKYGKVKKDIYAQRDGKYDKKKKKIQNKWKINKSIRHKEGKEERNHHHHSCFNALWSILILCK